MSNRMELELVSLTKRYGATVAVDAISYHFSAGTCVPAGSVGLRKVFHTKDDCRA